MNERNLLKKSKNMNKKRTVTPIKYKPEKRRKSNGRLEKLLEDENRTAQELNKCQPKENSIISSQSSSSQESIVISDDELNYSSFQSKEIKCKSFYNLQDCEKETLPFINEDNFEDIHLALKTKYTQQTQLTHKEIEIVEVSEEENSYNIINPITDMPQEVLTVNDSLNDVLERESIIKFLEEQQETAISSSEFSQSDVRETSEIDHLKVSSNVETPEKGVIIKTTDVTPMPNYNQMDTPKIRAELDKIGVKPLKRRRGVQLLEHIYNCTHPTLNPQEIENIKNADRERNKIIKKRKVLFEAPDKNKEIIANVECDFHVNFQQGREDINIIGDLLLKNEKFEELIFEKKYSKKVQSCAVPLQIVWYNFLMANPKLHENILSYEPLHLEVIHCMLKEQSGCKFNIQDLITFLDKKCIIFRVQQSSHQMKSKK